MSNTLNLDPKKIIILYSGTVLSIIAGGKHRRFFAEDSGKEVLTQIYEVAKEFKNTGSDESREKLAQFMQPDFRIETEDGYLKDMNGNYYLPETPHVPIYPTVKKMLEQYKEEGLDPEPIMNLWKLSLNNPSEQARKDLMTYIEQYGVPVTDRGYMILYKSVRDKNEVIEKLAYVVGREYFEKMRRRDQNPLEWWVYELPEDAIYAESHDRFFVTDSPDDVVYERAVEGEWQNEEQYEEYDRDDSPDTEEVPLEPIGNLAELFRDLVINKQDLEASEEETAPIFEPYHRGDYGMEIHLGKVVTMPREKCDPDINRECSYGLHVGSYEYVSKFGQSDQTTLACLVNPSDIVALPQYDNSKIRTCAYLPYGIIKKDEHGNWEEAETSYWEEDFIDYETDQLEARIAELQAEMEGSNDSKKASLEELVKVAQERLVSLKED